MFGSALRTIHLTVKEKKDSHLVCNTLHGSTIQYHASWTLPTGVCKVDQASVSPSLSSLYLKSFVNLIRPVASSRMILRVDEAI